MQPQLRVTIVAWQPKTAMWPNYFMAIYLNKNLKRVAWLWRRWGWCELLLMTSLSTSLSAQTQTSAWFLFMIYWFLDVLGNEWNTVSSTQIILHSCQECMGILESLIETDQLHSSSFNHLRSRQATLPPRRGGTTNPTGMIKWINRCDNMKQLAPSILCCCCCCCYQHCQTNRCKLSEDLNIVFGLQQLAT